MVSPIHHTGVVKGRFISLRSSLRTHPAENMVDTAQYREVRIPAKYSRGTRRPGSSPSWHGNFAEKRMRREEEKNVGLSVSGI